MTSTFNTAQASWEARFFDIAARRLDLQAEASGTLRRGDGRSQEVIQADLHAVNEKHQALMAERGPSASLSV